LGVADPGDPSLTPLQRAEARIHNLVLKADRLLAESGNARLNDRSEGASSSSSTPARSSALTREEESEAVCRFFAAPGDLASFPLESQVDALVADVDALGVEGEPPSGPSLQELEVRCAALRVEAEARGSASDRERMENVAGYLGSFAASIREQGFRESEAELLSRLHGSFEVVLVPGGGGECLFVACLLAQQSSRLMDDAKATPAEAADACRQQVSQGFPALLKGAAKLRCDAVKTLRKREQFHDAILDQLVLVMAAATEEGGDETTVRLRRGLRQRHPGRADNEIREELVKARTKGAKSASRRQAIEAYLAVMADKGTFGERTEVAALSCLLKRPIRVFYYTPGANEALAASAQHRATWGDSETTGADSARHAGRLPVEVFGHKYESRPIDLFHESTNRHFHVLIPRAASTEWRTSLGKARGR